MMLEYKTVLCTQCHSYFVITPKQQQCPKCGGCEVVIVTDKGGVSRTFNLLEEAAKDVQVQE